MITIIITAYNRPAPLENLLKSLLSIDSCSHEINLVISIDNNGTPEVNDIANNFLWPFGQKIVVIHPQKLGLVKHFIWVGNQTEIYENVIFLEDDLLVSSGIINFSLQFIDFYKNDNKIAAASLYSPILNEATGTRFYAIEDGYDVYLFQHPYWGNIWMKEKWNMFKNYLEKYIENKTILPSNVASWDRSFKKIYIQFLIEERLTVVTPRIGLLTNNGCAGIHGDDMYMYQSTLMLDKHKKYLFPKYNESRARYDAFMEIDPEILRHANNLLSEYDFEVDLNGQKKNYTKQYILTTKLTKNKILTFSRLMKPAELAIFVNSTDTEGINLTKCDELLDSKSFYRKRRYLDIKKNYYIGVYASIYIIFDFFKLLAKKLMRS